MDLNYLYSRHQISLVNADAAVDPGARIAHQQLSRAYGEMIRNLGGALHHTGECADKGIAR
ncbi:hypothetical protein H9L12_00435 [Sphingomonas rhizophila]|uniref:Uncharacterized protein n=1 Tax=Sphingomonas rhizophila TaxID=2071607 RepID=A0A7G9SBE0_9SPHN|nr:hypothetical protein [Sphingomonas rhizophila]QNN65165.1 hypothetical protein H9L12_00435 [Sphingomonas rhizophila]